MRCIVPIVAGAFQALTIAEVIKAGRTETGPDHDYAELGNDGLKDGFAKVGAGFNGKVGIVREIWDIIGHGNFAIEELAQIKMFTQTHAAQFFQMPEQRLHVICALTDHIERHPTEREFTGPNKEHASQQQQRRSRSRTSAHPFLD